MDEVDESARVDFRSSEGEEDALRQRVDKLSVELQQTIARLSTIGGTHEDWDGLAVHEAGGSSNVDWDSILYATETGPIEIPIGQSEELLLSQVISPPPASVERLELEL